MDKNWAKYAKIKVFDTLIKIDTLVLMVNQFKRSLLCSFSSVLVPIDQKEFGFPEIWQNVAKNYAKYARMKVFDTSIKVDFLF